jgi:hypothetical protein
MKKASKKINLSQKFYKYKTKLPDSVWIVYTDYGAVDGRLLIIRRDSPQKHQITFE